MINRPWYWPDYYIAKLDDLDPNLLYAKGIRAIIFDFDNTLKYYPEPVIRAELIQHLQCWIEVFSKQKISIVSNQVTRTGKECLQTEASKLGLRAFATGLLIKPLPYFLFKAAQAMQVSPAQTLIIGDLLIADIIGGRLAGMQTALVQPLSQNEQFSSRFFRPLDRWLLKSLKPNELTCYLNDVNKEGR
ncbi:YqeG family HAD IIIA-type phosphatase [Candidatus Berkelbacteria bacterium]|nr:YqeG family HAD IIIA-type phosphatase [Candidatus Berkelbacteria bacterium]